jgi:hypothetical protein
LKWLEKAESRTSKGFFFKSDSEQLKANEIEGVLWLASKFGVTYRNLP